MTAKQQQSERVTVDYGSERTSGTPSSDRQINLLQKIMERERIVHDRRIQLEQAKTDIYLAIMTVDDGVLRALLKMRYISFLSWSDIADDMGYSEDYVRGKLHAAALRAVIIPDEDC